MQPNDVNICVEIVGSDSVVGPRYGSTIGDLRQAWTSILGSEAAVMVVFEELVGSRATVCAVAVAVFVHDRFLRELKTRPFWVGPELARRVVRGDSPLLSDRQVADANSRDGLNVLVWETSVCNEFARTAELHRALASAFIDSFRGFLLNEAISDQVETVERLQWVLETGGAIWDPLTARYLEGSQCDLGEIIKSPYVAGISRETENRRLGTWIGVLFEYSPPHCGFSSAERRLLAETLRGEWGTDQQLARALHVSVPTIKKMWLSIYRRAAVSLPDLIPETSQTDSGTPERGKEKRRRLLAYVRNHPEELRPVSRRLVQQGGPRA
jgi:hypothetical protein